MAQNTSLTDKDIALDLLTSSKTGVTTLAKALTETTNPQLRQTLKTQLTNCIDSHCRLSDMAINKGWYNAYESPQEQLQQDLSNINTLMQ